jgi:hypothetical protein
MQPGWQGNNLILRLDKREKEEELERSLYIVIMVKVFVSTRNKAARGIRRRSD